MILLIDNYDSFSYNLYQLVGSLNPDIWVVRNDELSVEEIRRLSPSHLILSPGPGRPAEAGVCEAAVRELAGSIPLLGVCHIRPSVRLSAVQCPTPGISCMESSPS